MADEECLDRVAEAFAKVVDAKSPWTYQHSTRVAEIAVGVAEQFGVSPELRRDIVELEMVRGGRGGTLRGGSDGHGNDERGQKHLHADLQLV